MNKESPRPRLEPKLSTDPQERSASALERIADAVETCSDAAPLWVFREASNDAPCNCSAAGIETNDGFPTIAICGLCWRRKEGRQ